MKKLDFLLNTGKIIVILVVFIFLVGNIEPYYEAKDAHLYGVVAVNLSNGIYSDTNKLLQETGRSEFVGSNWIQTIHDTAIPTSGAGLSVIGAFFYILGGYTGLLLVSPIFAILLLVFSERIATNLFGKYVGLLALLFLATSNLLYRNSILLLTEAVFTTFFILGTFFLIKSLKTKKNYQFFLTSLFFVFAAFIRTNGIIFFPIEISAIAGYFVITNYPRIKITKSTLKTAVLILIPLIIFAAFYLSHNAYFFGDPFTNYLSQLESYTSYETEVESLLKFERQDFENAREYSKYLLPYQFPAVFNRSSENLEDTLGHEWLGVLTLLILSSILLISLLKRKKRTELIIFSVLIVGNLWFFSSITTELRASVGVAARYMLPSFTLTSIIFGYVIVEFFNLNLQGRKKLVAKTIKSLKVTVFIVLIGFFIIAFYFWPTMDGMLNSGINLGNVEKLASRYPLDLEGLDKNSVVIAVNADRVRDYGFIPFELSNPDNLKEESVILLRQIMQEGYEVYTLKESTTKLEKEYLRFLINEYGFTIKEHSESFCKIDFSDSQNEKNDEICLNDEE